MTDLDACNRTGVLDGMHDFHEAIDMTVIPQSGIAWRNTPLRRDCGGFHNDKAYTAPGQASVMREVPIVEVSVNG